MPGWPQADRDSIDRILKEWAQFGIICELEPEWSLIAASTGKCVKHPEYQRAFRLPSSPSRSKARHHRNTGGFGKVGIVGHQFDVLTEELREWLQVEKRCTPGARIVA